MRIRTVAAFAAGVMAAAAGSAFATGQLAGIVGQDGKIHGCYLTSAGLLRVTPEGQACRDGESAIAWSATGSGERGPAGPVGAAGPVGPKGAPGARWRGVWSASQSSTYVAGDLVRHNGSVWIHQSGLFTCLVGQDCVTPGSSPFWARFAQDGQQGAAGGIGPRGSAGPAGPQGPKGDKGEKGDAGAPGAPGPAIAGYEIVRSHQDVSGFYIGMEHVYCPPGKKALGGGADGRGMSLRRSSPMVDDNFGRSGWEAEVYNGSPVKTRLSVYAICAQI